MTHTFHARLVSLALAVLTIASLAALAGCTTRQQPRPDVEAPITSRLDRVEVPNDGRVFVDVYGYDDAVCADTADLIAAVLQSDAGCLIADSKDEATTIVEVKIRDVYLYESSSGKISAGQALGNTALGTVLGLGVGAVVGGRTGAAVGAGLGAAAGIGATIYDQESTYTWAMSTDMTIGPVDDMPDLKPHDVTVTGQGLDQQSCLSGLKEQLAQDIASSIRLR